MSAIGNKLYKLKYVLSHLPYYVSPNWLRSYNAESALGALSSKQRNFVLKRVGLYNQLDDEFSLSQEANCLMSSELGGEWLSSI